LKVISLHPTTEGQDRGIISEHASARILAVYRHQLPEWGIVTLIKPTNTNERYGANAQTDTNLLESRCYAAMCHDRWWIWQPRVGIYGCLY